MCHNGQLELMSSRMLGKIQYNKCQCVDHTIVFFLTYCVNSAINKNNQAYSVEEMRLSIKLNCS